jgi:glycosyltransferase involved in cell wall biosynthesis
MWPFDLPARETLRLPDETAIVWAAFDAPWYRRSYPDAVEFLEDRSDRALLTFYLDFGQSIGHSPNRYFDEAWHRRAYPNIAAAVSNGTFSSAFDAYCRTGNQDRSPHWLFDELHYRRRHSDLTNDAIVETGLVNGYDHFLRHGNREGRVGHPLFDPRYYLTCLDPSDRPLAEEIGPFQHYLRSLEQAPTSRETSHHFACDWYTQRYPDVAAAMTSGSWRSALEHYLCNDTPTAFDPGPDFSEDWYLASDPGLRSVIDSGAYRNGYAHFLRHGAVELRQPAPHIDLRWYAAQESVRDSLLLGETRDAFSHWLTQGKPLGYPAAPPPEEQIGDAHGRALFRRNAAAQLLVYGRAQLQFGCVMVPAISVAMVVRDDLTAALATLSSLRANTRADIDLILMVLGDSDIARFVAGATIQKLDEVVGVTAAAGAGLAHARAGVTLLLEPGTEIGVGSIDAVLRRLDSNPDIGAVGGKVLRPNGLVRSAGYVVWRDGRTHRYLDGEPALAPEANFTRDVPFCGHAFLAFRTALLQSLLERGAAPPVDDDAAADLCLRTIADRGRIVYDPAIMVWPWNDGATSHLPPIDTGLHAAFLTACHEADGRQLVASRSVDTAQRHLLLIEDTVPLRTIGSGFVRSNDLIGAMAASGWAVTVFPVNGCRFGLASVYADFPDSVEVMHDRDLSRLAEFLAPRRGIYDTIWIARTHNMDRVRPILDQVFKGDPNPPAIVLDTEAISSARDAALAALDGRGFDLDAALRREFASADICRSVIAVSDAEGALLREFGCPDVHVIGHVRPLRLTPRPFAQRSGMLFAGAIHRTDSPNYDSLCWFVDEVLPLVEQLLGWETRLTIAGYTAPDVTLDRFAHHPRITLRGAVGDLEPLYASHRLFVAPTRFAAGAPYKVHEAASYGLPVVATEMLRAQLGWSDGQEILAADARDPPAFAARIVALYRDAALWARLREAALARLARDNRPDSYTGALLAVLGPARLECLERSN